jgi:hypothetical protein
LGFDIIAEKILTPIIPTVSREINGLRFIEIDCSAMDGIPLTSGLFTAYDGLSFSRGTMRPC